MPALLAIGASIAIFLGAWGLIYLMQQEAVKRGRAEVKSEDAGQVVEQLSSRPHTDYDVVVSLRAKADARRRQDRSDG